MTGVLLTGEVLTKYTVFSLWVLFGIGVFFLLEYLFPTYRVFGESMMPTYSPGEMFTCRRLSRFGKKKIRVGDVICYRPPEPYRGPVIKRVTHIYYKDTPGNKKPELLYFCMGDNRDYSTDSREYGAVLGKRIICRLPEKDQRPMLNP